MRMTLCPRRTLETMAVCAPPVRRADLPMSRGGAGRSVSMNATNCVWARLAQRRIKRRSKPRVELGFPLIARPQAEPAKWAG